MTRETKVGLIVAGSFLALLGVVIASKMRGGADAPNNEVASAVTPGDEESGAPEKNPKAGSKDLPPPKFLPEGVLPAVGTTRAKDGDVPPPPAVDGGFKVEVPPLPKPGVGDPVLDVLAKEVAKSKKKDGEFPPPPDVPGFPKALDLPPIAKADTPPPVFPEKDKKDLPPPVFPPMIDKKDDLPPIFPPGGDKKDNVVPPPVFPAKDKKDDIVPPPVFPGADKKEDLPPPVVFPGAGKVEKIDVPPPMGKKDLPPIPPIDPGLDKKGPAVVVTPPIVDKKDGPPPVPPLGADFKGFEKPPVGIAPPSKDLPKVVSVDILPYILRPDDRGFEDISRNAYKSEKYAKALLAFNREHPMAAKEVKATPPVLIPGKTVYVPPVEFLTEKYASLIEDARPVIGASGPDVPPVKIGGLPPPVGATPDVPPIGVGKTPGVPVSIGNPMTPGSVPSRADATKKFVVPATGQFILQIAQQTLGDSRRWPEIYRLNPSVQPSSPIPGGTELRLPMDARVP